MGAGIGTRLFTRFRGVKVGADEAGNAYYREKRPRRGRRERRWAIYAGGADASSAPPEWRGWLTHTLDSPPSEAPLKAHPWQKPHLPNPTGGPGAYRPPGALLSGRARDRATGDYEAWTPPG